MTSKKSEMMRALEHGGAGVGVPLWELEFHLWKKFTRKPFVMGEEFAGLPAAERERAIGVNTEVFVEVSERLGFSALTVPGGYWEVAPGHAAYYWLPPGERLKQAKALVEALGEKLLVVANTGGVMCMPAADCFEEFSYLLFDEPERVEAMAEEGFEKGLRSMEAFSEIGVGAVLTASDLADNRGGFFTAAQMERFVYPFVRRFASAAKERGLHSILHTDGNIGGFVDELAKCGLSGLQGIDPVAGMELRALQERHGERLALCGNVDCGVLLTGKPEEVFEQAAGLLDRCKGDGSFVFGASNAVQVEVPVENYLAMIEAWRARGRAGGGAGG